MTLKTSLLPEQTLAAFADDGAVAVRGLFADWVEILRAGVERNMREPGPYGREYTPPGGQGRFFGDYCNWERIPEYRDFVLQSPAAALAGAVMRSRTAQFFHEHVLVKEPGTSEPTPWHHDLPYYCIEGTQTVSIWLALDPVPEEVCVRYVAGSHLWGRLFSPRRFKDSSTYEAPTDNYEPVPDINAEPDKYRILRWSLQPGDAILFDFRTLHGAPGNPLGGRRRGFANRWVGDDVRFVERSNPVSPPFPGIGLRSGDRLREDWFPVLWRAD